MKTEEEKLIELANKVHEKILKWNPLSIKTINLKHNNYDLLEKRFISGIINSESNEIILKKVKGNLEQLGLDFNEISISKKQNIEDVIISIITELKKNYS